MTKKIGFSVISFRLNGRIKEKLYKEAYEYDVSVSEYIRMIIRNYLHRRYPSETFEDI